MAEGPALNAIVANGPCPTKQGAMERRPDDSRRPAPETDTDRRMPGDCCCRTPVPDAWPGSGRPAAAWLSHLYLCRGLSTYRIGDITGLDRQRVTRLLHKAGVPLRPQGRGGTRPEHGTGDPAGLRKLLAELYLRQRLTTGQIAAVTGIPDRTIRDRLRRYGIRSRTRGGWDREDRRTIPAGTLHELYSVAGLSADEIARKLGTSRKTVLRNAHDMGLAVRTGGAVPLPGPDDIELINALYADAMVAAVLDKHELAHVPAGGPIWERFPEPVPLSRQLVDDLYWRCGVGLYHIELLTGQPAHTVRGFMRRTAIPVRDPGGRSPFLRRWRAGSPSPGEV